MSIIREKMTRKYDVDVAHKRPQRTQAAMDVSVQGNGQYHFLIVSDELTTDDGANVTFTQHPTVKWNFSSESCPFSQISTTDSMFDVSSFTNPYILLSAPDYIVNETHTLQNVIEDLFTSCMLPHKSDIVVQVRMAKTAGPHQTLYEVTIDPTASEVKGLEKIYTDLQRLDALHSRDAQVTQYGADVVQKMETWLRSDDYAKHMERIHEHIGRELIDTLSTAVDPCTVPDFRQGLKNLGAYINKEKMRLQDIQLRKIDAQRRAGKYDHPQASRAREIANNRLDRSLERKGGALHGLQRDGPQTHRGSPRTAVP